MGFLPSGHGDVSSRGGCSCVTTASTLGRVKRVEVVNNPSCVLYHIFQKLRIFLLALNFF